MLKKLQETTVFIQQKIKAEPKIGIILGTGLGKLGQQIENSYSIPYAEIPNFPVSTVKGHAGKLIFGEISGKNIVSMQGRFHYYEGYSMQEVAFPVRVMRMLGVEYLIISNAAGGMNPGFNIGDLMIITDHINLMPSNPLIGPNIDELGPRFPDMSDVYTKDLVEKAKIAAQNNNLEVQTGVYASVPGPTFETPAEYKYIRTVGADAVGMSTVPEAIVARHMDMKIFAVSVITDLGIEGQIVEVTHEEVIEAANNSEPKLSALVKDFIKML